MDEQQDKESRLEFLKATGGFIKEALPVIQSSPQAAPLLVALLKFGVTAFKVGKTIEGDFDQALDMLKDQASQPQPPKPDPEMAKVEAQKVADQARVQADAQAEAMRMQAEERQRQQEAAQEQQRMFMEQQAKAQQAREDAAFARFEALLKARTAVEVAEISANATISAQQESAARQATQ
jgi:hypothetical protein